MSGKYFFDRGHLRLTTPDPAYVEPSYEEICRRLEEYERLESERVIAKPLDKPLNCVKIPAGTTVKEYQSEDQNKRTERPSP